MRTRPRLTWSVVSGAAVIVVALIVSVALSVSGSTPTGSAGESGSAKPAQSSTPLARPTFAPAGSAQDNIAFFRSLVESSVSVDGLNASTESVAQKLAAAGFEASGIQFTDNATALGLTPDSVTVAALFKGQCLIAQYGPSLSGLSVTTAPELKSGGCLLGRSINKL